MSLLECCGGVRRWLKLTLRLFGASSRGIWHHHADARPWRLHGLSSTLLPLARLQPAADIQRRFGRFLTARG